MARSAAKPIPGSGSAFDWFIQIDRGVADAYRAGNFEPATEFSIEKLVSHTSELLMTYVSSMTQAKDFESKKLGLYTVEQEADELASEWMHDLGFDVKTPGDVDMAFVKLFESDDAYNACNEKRANDWAEADGKAIFVSWSEILLDPHPSACFRVRNQDLEAKAHGYKNPANGPRKLPPAAEWAEIISTIPKKEKSKLAFAKHQIGSARGVFRDARPLKCRFDR